MNAVTTVCPACEAPVEIVLEEISPGDCVVCSECDEALNVVSVTPLVLELDDELLDDDDEDGDEDFEDDDDEDGDEDFEDDDDEDGDEDFEDDDDEDE